MLLFGVVRFLWIRVFLMLSVVRFVVVRWLWRSLMWILWCILLCILIVLILGICLKCFVRLFFSSCVSFLRGWVVVMVRLMILEWLRLSF